jgi:hypothetical protein
MNWAARHLVLQSLTRHAEGALASRDWLFESWDSLKSGRGKRSLNNYVFIAIALGGLATQEHLAQVEKFFEGRVEKVSSHVPVLACLGGRINFFF